VSSLSLELPGAVVSQPRLEAWLAALLWDRRAAAATLAPPLPPPPAVKDAHDEGAQKADAAAPLVRAPATEEPFGFLAMEVFRMKGVLAVADSREDDAAPPGRASAFKHLLQVPHPRPTYPTTTANASFCQQRKE
jgi:hypothetical protein